MVAAPLQWEFDGELFYWRGPAPWYFVTVPAAESGEIHDISQMVTYGWGVIPATVRIGASRWDTALFPKGERYLVPVKAAVRQRERIDEGDTVSVCLTVAGPR